MEVMNSRSLRQDHGIVLDGRIQADVVRRALVCLLLGAGCLGLERLLDGGVSDPRLLVARFSGFLGWSFLVASTVFLLSLLGNPVLFPEFRPRPPLGAPRDRAAERSRRIDALYAELRPLMSRAAADPSLKGEVQAKLSVLRRLQTEEADEMEKRFDAGLLLKPGEGWQALERARELLARHENPSAPDAPGLPKN
jgi:hypothetical protein